MSSILFTILLLLGIHTTIVTSYCRVSWSGTCSSSRSAILNITFQATDEDNRIMEPTYLAEVTVDWDMSNDASTSTGYQSYEANEWHTEVLNQITPYGEDGEYEARLSVTFGEGAGSGCANKVFYEDIVVWFDRNARPYVCGIESLQDAMITTTLDPATAVPITSPPKPPKPTTNSPSRKPTLKPTNDATNINLLPTPVIVTSTISPTPKPTTFFELTPTTSEPTPSPTEITDVGSERTVAPSVAIGRPTLRPTLSPTKATLLPTRKPTFSPIIIELPPSGPSPTNKPVIVEWGDNTLAPTIRDEEEVDPPTTGSSVGEPTSEPTAPAGNEPTAQEIISTSSTTTSTTMTMYYSNQLTDTLSQEIWIDVTQQTIYTEALSSASAIENTRMRDLQGMTSDVDVNVTILSQRGGGEAEPLEIDFMTTITTSTTTTTTTSATLNATDIVTTAFDTPNEQNRYIDNLQDEDLTSAYFGSLESMSVQIMEAPPPANDNKVPLPTPKNNTLYYIIAGVVAGVLGLGFGAAIGIYHVRRKRRRNDGGGKDSDHNKKSTSATQPSIGLPMKMSREQQQNMDKVGQPINEQQQISSPFDQQRQQSLSLDFGIIESKEGEDDVSTIGDPYFGDAPMNHILDTDNTVGESMVSSQEERYVYGVQRPHAGMMDAPSRYGGSTIGTNTITSGPGRMIFVDDTTLEDIYQSPSGSTEDDNEDGDLRFQRIAVVCPPGKLGIVLDNPHGDLPIVYAIKETSPLHGKIRVGDLLLSVDEVDCRGMSAHRLSQFLSSRSQNMERHLVLARGLGINGAVTVAV